MAEELRAAIAQQADASSEGMPSEVCLDLHLSLADPVEIYRYLGYPVDATPTPHVAEQINGIVAEALRCLKPRGAYTVYRVCGRAANSLKLDRLMITGNIGEYLEAASRVAVFVVTVGEEISHLAEATAKNGDTFSALVMDATGSWAAEATADALMLRIRSHLGDEEELTLRYSPGYCGMELGQQHKLFQLVPANSVGVTLMPSMLMHPLKSISGLAGLAPKDTVNRHRSPCDVCPRVTCHMRR